jgi:hypothetical protein
MSVIDFIQEYWFLIVAAVAAISVISIKIYLWFKKPGNEQLEQVKQWLIYAVAKAEAELGSGTGQLKLRYVYDQFIKKFPAIAIFISFEDFSKMVDAALEELEKMMKENKEIGMLIKPDEYIEKEDEE